MKNPLVSVLITVYNDEHNIANALESILNQTYQNFEIIVVNDGSTDSTAAVLEEYQSKDKRIRVIFQDNQGTAAAANKGISYCKGKYIARLDSDDISYSCRLEQEVTYLEKHPEVGLIGGGCHIADHTGRIIGSRNIKTTNAYKTLLNRCIYQQSDVMIRKSVLEKIPGRTVYRSKFKAEDYDLWLRISEVSEVAKLNTILGIWKLNIGGYTLARKKEQLEAIKELKKMAVARRNGQPDWYDQFTPIAKSVAHRTPLKGFEYDLAVAQVLLKELRFKEVRLQLDKYKNDREAWPVVMKWYYMTLLPKPLIRLLFSFREFLLNNSALEIR